MVGNAERHEPLDFAKMQSGLPRQSWRSDTGEAVSRSFTSLGRSSGAISLCKSHCILRSVLSRTLRNQSRHYTWCCHFITVQVMSFRRADGLSCL